MRDILVQTSGALGLLIACLHSVIGEKQLFARVQVDPASSKRMLRAVWHASAVAWGAVGVLLIVAPSLGSYSARQAIIATAVGIYGFGAIGNAWVTGARHFGWAALAVTCVLALAGL